MSNQIVFIDSRGVIGSNPDALKRHKFYASEYVSQQIIRGVKPTKFQICSASRPPVHAPPADANLKVHHLGKCTRVSPRFLLQTLILLRGSRKQVRVFICGDPWESFWSTYLLKKLLRFYATIQVNIHADVFDPKWTSQSFTNKIRKILIPIAIRSSQSVRVVSMDVHDQLLSKYPDIKIFFAPIAIMLVPPTQNRVRHKAEKITVGWVGRLAEDRGVFDFIDLIRRINTVDRNFRVLVAGSGPLEQIAKVGIESIVGSQRVDFLGMMDQINLPDIYSQIDVLVSCAKSESYGLAIREALVCGTPIWALKSQGVQALQSELGTEFIQILNLDLSDIELGRKFREISKTIIPVPVSKAILRNNEKVIGSLFDSWDLLIDSTDKLRNL